MVPYTPSADFTLSGEDYAPSSDFVFEDTFGAVAFVSGASSKSAAGSLAPVSLDADFDKVMFLLQSGSQAIVDSKGNTVSVNGSPQYTALEGKLSSGSFYFDGTDDRIDCTLSSAILGTGEFTIEFWFKRESNGVGVVFNNRTPGNASDGIDIWENGRASTSYNWLQGADLTSTYLAVGTWHHFVIGRSSPGVPLPIYIDGVLVGQGAASNDFSSVTLHIGGRGYDGEFFRGWVDQLRITKGLFRYSSNFTPPQLAFPTVTTSSVVALSSAPSVSVLGTISTDFEGQGVVHLEGTISQGFAGTLSVFTQVVQALQGILTKGYLGTVVADSFSDQSGEDLDLIFGLGWPSQTAEDLKLHFFVYQTTFVVELDRLTPSIIGTVPKVEGFLFYNFEQGYSGVNAETVVFNFMSVTEYLDGILGKVTSQIYLNTGNVADFYATLDDCVSDIRLAHVTGTIGISPAGPTLVSVTRHANGTLSKTLASVTSSISGRVPIAINGNLSSTLGGISVSISAKYSSGQMSRVLDSITVAMVGTTQFRGYISITTAGINRNITGEFHSPIQGILATPLVPAVFAATGFYIPPVDGHWVSLLENVYSEVSANQSTSGIIDIVIEDYYIHEDNEFSLGEEVYYPSVSPRVNVAFSQAAYAVEGALHAIHAYGYLSATTGASTLVAHGGVAEFGTLDSGYEGYTKSTDFNLQEWVYEELRDFTFKDPNSFTVAMTGIYPATVMNMNLGSLSASFLAITEIEGVLYGDAEYTPYQPHVFQFSHNRAQQHEYFFYWKTPSMQPVTAAIQGLTIYGPYGRLEATLENLSKDIRGFGHVFGDIVSYSNNSDYSKNVVFDFAEGFVKTKNFAWWKDSLGTSVLVIGTTTEEFPIFHVVLDNVVPVLNLQTPYHPEPQAIVGRFHNVAEYVPPITFEDKNFRFEEDQLLWFRDSSYILEFDRSDLDFTAGLIVKHIPLKSGSLLQTLAGVSSTVSGVGEILGYWGGEYEIPELLLLDFEKYGWYLNRERDFLWNYSPHLEDSYMVIRGGEVTGVFHQTLSNLLPTLRLAHPVPVTGTMSGNVPGFSTEILLNTPLPMWLEILTGPVTTEIRLQTWLAAQANLDIVTGKVSILMKGMFPIVARIDNQAPLGVYASFRAETIVGIRASLIQWLSDLRWYSTDSSRRGSISIDTGEVFEVDFRGSLSILGSFHLALTPTSLRIGGVAPIGGDFLTTLAEVVSEILVEIPEPVYAHLNVNLDAVTMTGYGASSIFGIWGLGPQEFTGLIIKETKDKFLGFTAIRGDLIPETSGLYTLIRGLTPGNYFGWLASAPSALTVQADFSGGSTLEGLINTKTAPVVPTIKGSTVGLYFWLNTQDVSTDIRLRATINVSIDWTLKDATFTASGITPKLVQGIFETETLSPITYFKVHVKTEVEIAAELEGLYPEIYGAGVVGVLDNPKLANLVPHINIARQGPLFTTLASTLETIKVSMDGRVQLWGRFIPELQRFGIVAEGKVPIPYYGGMNFETRGLKFTADGTRYYYTYVDFTAYLHPIVPMLKIFFPVIGELPLAMEGLKSRIFAETPLAIEASLELRIGSGFYTSIKLAQPTRGYLETITPVLISKLQGFLFIGRLHQDLSEFRTDLRARILSNTKIKLEPITGSPILNVIGMINTEGYIESDRLGEGLSFYADARIPPKLVRIRGTFESGGLTTSINLPGFHYGYKLNIDVFTPPVTSDIRARLITIGVIDQELWTVLPDMVGEFLGSGLRMDAHTAGVVGRFKAAFKVFGSLTVRLSPISLAVEHYIPSVRIGVIEAVTDRNWGPVSATRLGTFIYGEVPTIAHGRMDTHTLGLLETKFQLITPFDIFGIVETRTEDFGVQGVIYCEIAGEIVGTQQVIDGTFVGVNMSFVMDIVMDRYEATLEVDIRLATPGGFPMRMFLKMEPLRPTFQVVSEIFVKFDIKTSDFKMSRIIGDLGVVGMIIGGDSPYDSWWSAIKDGPTAFDYHPAGGGHNRKKYADVVAEAGYNPGKPEAPQNKRFWTLDYTRGTFLGKVPVQVIGDLDNYWQREDFYDPWWAITDYSSSERQGGFFPQYTDTRFYIAGISFKGYVPIQGTMHINSLSGPLGETIPGYDLDLRTAWPYIPGFQGYLGNYQYKATWHRSLRDLKPKIIMDFRSYEGLFDNFLKPVSFLSHGTALAYGWLSGTVFAEKAIIEMTAPHHTWAKMNPVLEGPLPRIKLEAREYIYGILWQAFLILNEDVAEVDAEYSPTRLQFHGTVPLFGSMTIDFQNAAEHWVFGDIQLAVTGTFAVIKSKLSPLRPRISGRHTGYSQILAGMNLYMEPVSFEMEGDLNSDGWLSLRNLNVYSSIRISVPFIVKGVLGEERLEYATWESFGIVEVFGDLSTVTEDCFADMTTLFALPKEGILETSTEDFSSTVVACIPAEGTFDNMLEGVNPQADFSFGPSGRAHVIFDDLIKSIFINRYHPSDVIPPEYGKQIAGDVSYSYERNKGSVIRIYDDETEEVLFTSHLTSQDTDYSFANVMEGEYYVVGVPSNWNSSSEVLDELTVELDI